MKTINMIFVEEFGEADAFFDGQELLTYWWGNDANWRNEYFDPLLAKLGIKVRVVRKDKQPKLYAQLREKLRADIESSQGYDPDDVGDEGDDE